MKQQIVKFNGTTKCEMCHTKILGYFPPGQPKRREHSTKKLGTGLHYPRVGPILKNPIGANTKKEACAYKQNLYARKLEQGDLVTFNFALELFSIEKLNSKLDDVIGHLKYATKINVVFDFVVEFIEDLSCRFVSPERKFHCWRNTN